MKIDFSQGKVTLVVVPFDLRYGYYRLAQICSEFLHIDLSKGEDYVVFISRRRHTAKIVHSDSRGNLLLTRTLHQGKFQQLMTRAEGVAAEPLSVQELERYLDGEPITVVRTSVLKG
jgi:hypothetical protein